MDRLLEQNHRACMRDAMMRQEETFKQQVHDLHRLYQVQKVLMTENKCWSDTSPSETSYTSCIVSNRHHQNKMVEEPSVRHKGFDLEQLVEEKATTSCVQSKELRADEECEVELTLSVGRSSSKKKHRNSQPSETREPLWSQTRSRNEISEECREKESLQRSPWFFQALSFSRT